VDVGRDQLHSRLRARPDVIALERTDIRKLDPLRLPEPPHFVTVDTSFISLERVLPAALAPSRAPAGLLALIKPQFESGPLHAKHGIVRDSHVHDAACKKISAFVAALGWEVIGIAPSVIAGGDGNQEFFIAATRGQTTDDRRQRAG